MQQDPWLDVGYIDRGGALAMQCHEILPAVGTMKRGSDPQIPWSLVSLGLVVLET